MQQVSLKKYVTGNMDVSLKVKNEQYNIVGTQTKKESNKIFNYENQNSDNISEELERKI